MKYAGDKRRLCQREQGQVGMGKRTRDSGVLFTAPFISMPLSPLIVLTWEPISWPVDFSHQMCYLMPE